jgi:uncharacterized protein (TIGR01440 family)
MNDGNLNFSVADQVEQAVRELAEAADLKAGQILVIGASTSEVAGRRIGTAGSMDIAGQIWEGVERVRRERGFHAAYQCCEHLNRALVVESELAERDPRLVRAAAVPHPDAGGAMAACAWRKMADPCLVESIQAHAGLDIGDTLIGMHLRPVAVPFRPSLRRIGEAHLTAARTRPKYIGGPRAKYTLEAGQTGEITKQASEGGGTGESGSSGAAGPSDCSF